MALDNITVNGKSLKQALYRSRRSSARSKKAQHYFENRSDALVHAAERKDGNISVFLSVKGFPNRVALLEVPIFSPDATFVITSIEGCTDPECTGQCLNSLKTN